MFRGFPRTFWIANSVELLERAAYRSNKGAGYIYLNVSGPFIWPLYFDIDVTCNRSCLLILMAFVD